MKTIGLVGATGLDWLQSERKKQFVIDNTPEGFEVKSYIPRFGTHSVESRVDETYNAPFILEKIVEANRDGVDGIIIDCACDPILEAACEISDVPVIGPLHVSLHVALTLGNRFGIITVQGLSLVKCLKDKVQRYGLHDFLAGIQYITMPVLDIANRPQEAQNEIMKISKAMIENTGVEVIILGCTGLSHEVDIVKISKDLNLPVLDPFIVAMNYAAFLVNSNLTQSRIAYPVPPRKKISEPPSLKDRFNDVLRE